MYAPKGVPYIQHLKCEDAVSRKIKKSFIIIKQQNNYYYKVPLKGVFLMMLLLNRFFDRNEDISIVD